MTKLISSIIRGIGSLVKTTLAVLLLVMVLVSLLSLSFSGQLSTKREETSVSDSSSHLKQIQLLEQQLELAKQGHGIQIRGELCFLGELIIIGCDSETIFVSDAQFSTLTSGQVIASQQVDGLLGQLGLAAFRLVVV